MIGRVGLIGGLIGGALAGVVIVAALARSPLPPRLWLAHPWASLSLARGENPYPIHLKRPAVAPLSAMAELGRQIFFDPRLSSSGELSCATCHQPDHAYGPAGDAPAIYGGPDLARQGVRAVPSLMYLERQPNFSIGPDDEETESTNLAQLAALGQGAARAQKTAQDTAQAAANLVPQGGLFWDGRADTLQDQALYPLLSPFEMDGGSIEAVAKKLEASPYAALLSRLFGPGIFESPRLAVAEALFAVGRYEFEEPSFHPYSSKFDAWLEGRARFTAEELQGYLLFNDPAKANCGGCHLDQPRADGLPPLFTDGQFEALGVPRNPALKANRDPAYFDLGLCGPYRSDLRTQTQYCGLFVTPTLRNAATRRVFFHNGVYHDLQQVMDFYDFRDTAPAKVYPGGKFDDLPPEDWPNIDVTDPPFDRVLGQAPAITQEDERAIIAFLETLTDGYQPNQGQNP